MDAEGIARLGLTWNEVWLTVLSAAGIYTAMVVLSRLYGSRQFSRSSSYDLAFVFGLGSVIGRVVLVRTSLLTGVIGLTTLFALHAVFGWLHHHLASVHRLMQNQPVVLVADGEIMEQNLHHAHVSHVELYQQLRMQGQGSLQGVRAVVLERNGNFSVVMDGTPLTEDVFGGVVGAQRLLR